MAEYVNNAYNRTNSRKQIILILPRIPLSPSSKHISKNIQP